jgi:hypothetical protein
MKNNLEHAFKDKLNEFEAPYDPQAWEAVKNKLDAKVTGGGSSSTWKWIAATAVFATIAITSIVVLNNTETTVAETKSVIKEETLNNDIDDPRIESEDKNVDVNQANKGNNGIAQNTVPVSDKNLVEETNSAADLNNEETNPKRNGLSSLDEEVTTPSSKDNGSVVPENIQETATPNKHKYIAGNISAKVICHGEQVKITNSGAKNEIVRLLLNDEITEIKKANTFTIKPEASIVINFVDKNNMIIESEFIKVNELPTSDFTYEANIFEDGLPVTICEAYGDFESLKWNFDGESEKEGKKVKHHFFDKGNYKVSLTVTDFNGCENSKEKDVRIEDQYNLMAVNFFKPNSSDHRNKSFMPFSLAQRNIPFTLTIIDPRDNGIVFTSKDVMSPWTGIDERTGEMTEPGTAFIWKVQLKNSLPNERPVYAGTVVHD